MNEGAWARFELQLEYSSSVTVSLPRTCSVYVADPNLLVMASIILRGDKLIEGEIASCVWLMASLSRRSLLLT